jgi:hypothetical protein
MRRLYGYVKSLNTNACCTSLLYRNHDKGQSPKLVAGDGSVRRLAKFNDAMGTFPVHTQGRCSTCWLAMTCWPPSLPPSAQTISLMLDTAYLLGQRSNTVQRRQCFLNQIGKRKSLVCPQSSRKWRYGRTITCSDSLPPSEWEDLCRIWDQAADERGAAIFSRLACSAATPNTISTKAAASIRTEAIK